MKTSTKASFKKWIPAVLLVGMMFTSFSCTKDKLREKAEDFIITLIVDNNWVVTNFEEGSSVITPEFSSYEFDFHRNWKVDAVKSGQTTVTGTWSADPTDRTITSSFPPGIDLLQKFNGTWNIDKTTMSSVDASRSSGGVSYKLSLRKK